MTLKIHHTTANNVIARHCRPATLRSPGNGAIKMTPATMIESNTPISFPLRAARRTVEVLALKMLIKKIQHFLHVLRGLKSRIGMPRAAQQFKINLIWA